MIVRRFSPVSSGLFARRMPNTRSVWNSQQLEYPASQCITTEGCTEAECAFATV